jgi:hypothetical protein
MTDTDDNHAPTTVPRSQGAPPARAPRLPSLRMSAALAAGMLALGVVIGAAIGPAPSPSLAGEPLAQLLPRIAALAVAGEAVKASAETTAATPPPTVPRPTPSKAAASAVPANSGAGATSKPAQPVSSKAPSSASVSPTSRRSPAKTPAGAEEGAGAAKPLPPVTRVWLITLTGATLTQALTQPATASYIDAQLVPAGAVLGQWSALQGSALANEAALLGGEPPQTMDAIVQPPCPEGAAGAQCKPETAGALQTADEFLKQTVPTITTSTAYREHGLIVIAFGTIGDAAASSLPEGAATATLSSEPQAGVLILSPFAKAGSKPTTTYDPASPKRSLSELLR